MWITESEAPQPPSRQKHIKILNNVNRDPEHSRIINGLELKFVLCSLNGMMIKPIMHLKNKKYFVSPGRKRYVLIINLIIQ